MSLSRPHRRNQDFENYLSVLAQLMGSAFNFGCLESKYQELFILNVMQKVTIAFKIIQIIMIIPFLIDFHMSQAKCVVHKIIDIVCFFKAEKSTCVLC